MTDTNNSQEAAAKTVIDDMPNRRIFDTTEEAANYIAKCQSDFADFASYPIAAAGFTEDGDFDPEVYTEGTRVVVAVLTQRGDGAGSSTVKAIVIYPAPTLEMVLADPAAVVWLTGIMEKELNHVAVRQLRKADTDGGLSMAEAVEAMPTTLADFITSNREAAGGILETYNATWQLIKKALGSKFKAFSIANFSKKELRRAIESASYAATVYPAVELRKNKAGAQESLFEIAATFGVMLAKEQGLDPAFYERALADRNEKQIDIADDEDSEDFDLEAMAAAMTKPAEDSTPAADTDTDESQSNEAASE